VSVVQDHLLPIGAASGGHRLPGGARDHEGLRMPVLRSLLRRDLNPRANLF